MNENTLKLRCCCFTDGELGFLRLPAWPREAGSRGNVVFEVCHCSWAARAPAESVVIWLSRRKVGWGSGWQFRFAQAAAPGHCCWWCNFTTEVCGLGYRDGSLTTRNSSSHWVSCFLNSLTMKGLWHCFLSWDSLLRVKILLSSFSVIVTGAYLCVDSMSAKLYGQAPQRSLGFASGKRQPTLDLHELKEN